MANGTQDETEEMQDNDVPVTDQQQPLPPPTPAVAPLTSSPAMPIAPVPPGMARAWSTTRGVQSPVSTFIGAPVAPSDPRAALFRQQAQSNEALWRQLQQRTAKLPLAQAEAAVSAALRFQGQRQYDRDLAAGVPQAEAFARAAPLMFNAPKQSNLGQAAAFTRAISPAQPKYMDVGGTLYRVDQSGATPLTTPKAPPQAKPSFFEQENYRKAANELSDEWKRLRDLDVGDPEAQRTRNRIKTLQADLDAMRGRFENPSAPPAAAPRPATRASTSGAKRVRVRAPDGRFGSIPASQLDAAKAAGYSQVQ